MQNKFVLMKKPDAPLGGASTGLPGLGLKRPVVKTRNHAKNGI